MPPVFSVLNNFAFKTWEIYIKFSPLSVADVKISVGTTQPWELLPDHLLDLNIDELSLEVQFTGKLAAYCDLQARFVLKQQAEKPAVILLRASYPGFKFTGVLAEGYLDIPYLVGRYISAEAAALVPTSLKVDQLYLAIDPTISSYSFQIGTTAEWRIEIGGGSFTVLSISFALSRVAQVTSGRFSGAFRLGDIEPPILVDVAAGYNTITGWTFEGGLTEGSKVTFNDILRSYFPEWDLQSMVVTLEAFRVSYSPKIGSYQFQIKVLWVIHFPGWTVSLQAECDIACAVVNGQPTYKGFIRGILDIEGFLLSAEVTYPEQTVTLKLGGLTVVFSGDPVQITITFPNISLGDVIAMLVTAAIGENITLPAPWNVLNLINLANLRLTIIPSESFFEAEYEPKINLGFVSVEKFKLTYTGGQASARSRVEFSITAGSFLGQPISPEDPVKMNVLDPASAPKVPGAGDTVFALHFLAIGQRLALKDPVTAKTVTQAMAEVERAFYKKEDSEGSPVDGTGLIPSERASWIFGVRAEILSSITIRALFFDPDLYGLAISVGGAKFPAFTGLNFEILYKKVNENVGVYQIELKLPDAVRQLDFGSVSITLPIIALEIYTNGDFLIDFGFPANGNFTRSFAIQVLPFTGAGGFYFGVLSNATAKRLPPGPLCGSFSPVIEAGIGLRIGLGKDINKGVLKAGLSLTVQGIIEGTLAFYNDNLQRAQYDDALYYYISGQVAIVGQIYGEIDFKIVSARLDVLIRIGVTFVIQALEPIVLGFFAEITVSVKARINLGIFKITITLSFTATFRESFTIGSATFPKPWYDCSRAATARGFRARRIALDSFDPGCDNVRLVFNSLTRPESQKVDVPILFVPQFTPASQVNGAVQPSKAQCVATFNVETSAQQPAPAETAFDRLSRGVFLWTLRAYLFPDQPSTPEADVLSHQISLTALNQLYCALTRSPNELLFEATKLFDFFAAYFKFNVSLAEERENQIVTTIFPVLTPFILVLPDGQEIPFVSRPMVSSEYLQSVKDYYKPMQVDYLTPEEKAANASRARLAGDAAEKSLACWMMLDYFTLLVKDTTQAAIDTMTSMTTVVEEGTTIASILARYPASGATPEELVWANATTALSPGVAVGLSAPHAAEHRVHGDGPRTLFGIARHHNLTLDELARANEHSPGLFPPGRRIWFPLIESITVSDLLVAMQDQKAFEHLAGNAGRTLLAGLRPPAPDSRVLTPLYQLNLQQFDASGLQAGSSFSLKINADLSWLVFDSSDPRTLPVVISDDEAKVIAAFNNAMLDPQIQSLQPLDLYKLEPKSFGVGNATLWQSSPSSPSRSIWMFPENLQTILFDNPDARPQVELWESIQKLPNQAPQPIEVPHADYTWTTRIDVVVSRIRTRADELLPNTYEMRGAGVASSTVLQYLLTYATPSPVTDLHLLYLADPLGDFQGLLSQPVAGTQISLLQTNLSTEANPELLFARAGAPAASPSYIVGMTALDVLKYVWEASVVRSGGYYLYYKDTASGEGLPDYLFNDTDQTTVTLLATLNPAGPGLWPYINSLVMQREVDIQDTALYLRVLDQQFLERVPTIGPGLNGFTIRRTAPATEQTLAAITAAAATPFVSELYNLLNLQIADYGGFNTSPFAMPATPADVNDPDPDPNADRSPRLETSDWNYEAVAPIYRFSKVIPPPPPDLPPPLPPAEENPYRGIGSDVRFEISWLDLFGNRIETQAPPDQRAIDIAVRYFDNLIPVDKWPAVSSDYLVKKGTNGPELQVTLNFDAARYLPPPQGANEDYKSIALADRATYALIYYQLTQTGVTAAVSSTFDSSQTPCIRPLIEFALAIYQFLDAVLNGQNPPIPVNRVISGAVQDANPLQYYQLLVSISIKRPGEQIDAQLQNDRQLNSARKVRSFVSAQYNETNTGDPNNKPLTLRAFVEQLGQAFPNLAVATANPPVSWSAENTVKEIWVVRFGGSNGIVYDPKQPAFYLAPLPLSRALKSTEVSLYPYVSGQPIEQAVPQALSFSNVDMDLLAKSFLGAVDLVLSPQFVVPAWLALNNQQPNAQAPNAIERILGYKKDLAAAIAQRIAPVLAEQKPGPQNLEAATEKLRQQLLIRLSDLYAVDCIVQFNVTISSKFDNPSTAPRLFGQPEPKPTPGAAGTQDYSFSTAEISLCNKPDTSLLTFLFGTRDPSAVKNVALDMVYQRSNLQHGFSSIPGIPDYEASSWLAFYQLEQAEPATAAQNGVTDLGAVTVPVPLRAYPPSPVLLDQRALEQELVALPAAVNPILALAKLWVFEFTWNYSLADQDTLYSEVQFNVPGGAAFPKARAAFNLLGALLQFSTVYPDVLRDLEKSLILEPDPALATVTLNSLAWLIEQVSRAWPSWSAAQSSLLALPQVLTAKLRVTQAPAEIDGAQALSITVDCDTDGRPLTPTVELPGFSSVELPQPAASRTVKTYAYLNPGREYLSWSAGREIATRSIRFEQMNVLDEQTGWAGLYIRRNEVLIEGKPTNPAFVYETPHLRFASVLTPLLRPNVPINIADSSSEAPPSDKLYTYLLNFLLDFFGAGPEAGGTVKLSGSFVYDLNAGTEAVSLPVSLPVWMTLPTQVVVAPAKPPEVTVQEYCRSLSDFIVDWFAGRGLTGRSGQISAQLSLYSALANSNLPVLELQKLYLDTELIW